MVLHANKTGLSTKLDLGDINLEGVGPRTIAACNEFCVASFSDRGRECFYSVSLGTADPNAAGNFGCTLVLTSNFASLQTVSADPSRESSRVIHRKTIETVPCKIFLSFIVLCITCIDQIVEQLVKPKNT